MIWPRGRSRVGPPGPTFRSGLRPRPEPPCKSSSTICLGLGAREMPYQPQHSIRPHSHPRDLHVGCSLPAAQFLAWLRHFNISPNPNSSPQLHLQLPFPNSKSDTAASSLPRPSVRPTLPLPPPSPPPRPDRARQSDRSPMPCHPCVTTPQPHRKLQNRNLKPSQPSQTTLNPPQRSPCPYLTTTVATTTHNTQPHALTDRAARPTPYRLPIANPGKAYYPQLSRNPVQKRQKKEMIFSMRNRSEKLCWQNPKPSLQCHPSMSTSPTEHTRQNIPQDVKMETRMRDSPRDKRRIAINHPTQHHPNAMPFPHYAT